MQNNNICDLNEIIKTYNNKYNLDSLEVSSSARELIVMLLANIKKCTQNDIKLKMVSITKEDENILDKMLKEISENKIPPQYITNTVNIYNEIYYVDSNVLIPRQDTETLIEETINLINEYKLKSMLDMCTGSGIVGISTSKNSSINNVTLLDISTKALEVANKNIVINNVQNKCKTIQSNMFSKLYETNTKYDIITANPPYLTENEMKELSDFVKKEPTLALAGGKTGLDFYINIYNNAKYFLNDGGYIAVEIGYMQAEDIKNIISKHVEYTNIQVVQDINSKDRVIICRVQKI